MRKILNMSRRSIPVLLIAAYAQQAVSAPCFSATGSITHDAQTIRLAAEELGWKVGIPASVTASTAVKAKVVLYPKGNVEVCLRPDVSSLAIKAQATSSDDRDAKWRSLPGKRE